MSRSSSLLRPPPTSSRPPATSRDHRLSAGPLPEPRPGPGGSLQFQGQPSNHSTPPAPGGSSAPAPRSLVPSMAFALREQARLLLVHLTADRRNDAAGFTSCCGLVSCSAPLRTRPLDHARGHHYRGPWRLPGPDSHRLVTLSLTLGYTITTSLLSWRPNYWTHPSNAGYGRRAPPVSRSTAFTCRGRVRGLSTAGGFTRGLAQAIVEGA